MDLNSPNWLFGRWDWMVTHLWLDSSGISRIGVWEDDDRIVALATYDTELGSSYFNVSSGYENLYREMLEYSCAAFQKKGEYRALIGDHNSAFQVIARDLGYRPTADNECDAVFLAENSEAESTVPSGFRVQTLGQNCDVYKYGKVLWKGFNHEVEGEGVYNPTLEKLEKLWGELHRPNVDLDIKLVIVAPNGEYVSYCGMWYDLRSEYCLVEPIATDPDYRRLGLGRAAVLEGIRKCVQLGAKKAIVGSSQKFYYNIGFKPFATSSWWKRQDALA